ncbi:MAG: type I DNA topoisomerase [Chlamydiae bacterium]|nr:type I DNA topoisomerase [Chlamydiota bacterium]
MEKALIIVESPAKIKTLKKFLGNKYLFASSLGHIRDLPAKEFGIDVEHDFEPKYVTLPEKQDVIKKLKEAAKKVDVVYLSPDPDREGEAIAWHIASILPKNTNIKRTTFNSITRNEVLRALENPRDIDQALVNAQQARRLLDRIVGYKISPILNRKIKRGKSTSAGRVQSVALKLVVDREKEIESFKPQEYWNISSLLNPSKNEKNFEASIFSVDDKKVEKEKIENKDVFLIPTKSVADSIVAKLKSAKYKVDEIEKKEKKRHPFPPFITSTLQQEASRHYGFSASRTMNIAQGLYEGVDMKDEGLEGLITYMRTDSVQVVDEAIKSARDHISKEYGKEFLPPSPNFYSSKKSAQEAHEAIRPTELEHHPEKIKKYLTIDQYKLYLLIYRRFVASQMSPAIYDTVSATIGTDKKIVLKANGSVIKFQGFLAAYEEKKDPTEEEKDESKILPPLSQGQNLNLIEVLSSQSFTKPPARYTEASLIKELEKCGIGRPSTYATIMNKIQSRDYTIKERQTLKPTDLGKIIAQMLDENFAPIVNVGFTAAMEDDLELVAENKRNWKELLKEFWNEFIPMVDKAAKEATVPKILSEHKCPKCQKPLQKIWSKSKYFYGCTGYPECEFTIPIEVLEFKKEEYAEDFDWDQNCAKCSSKMLLRHGRFGPFLGCSQYPKCRGIVNIPKKGEKILSLEESPNCPALGCDGKIVARKSRFGKTFFSCTNFPECDVIVNNVEDLDTKYDAHHPKTAYKKAKPAKGEKGKKGTKSKSALSQIEYDVSSELEKIIKVKKVTRPELLKKVWEYIKSNNLQDPKNKRTIVPDKNLAKVFGSDKPVDMMKMGKFFEKHLKKS